MASKITDVEIVVDNWLKTHKTKLLVRKLKTWLTNYYYRKSHASGIARITDVPEPWLQGYVNAKYKSVSQQVQIKTKKKAN